MGLRASGRAAEEDSNGAGEAGAPAAASPDIAVGNRASVEGTHRLRVLVSPTRKRATIHCGGAW